MIYNHSICCWHCWHFVVVVLIIVAVVVISLEMRSTLGVYTRIVLSVGNEGHKSSSALAVTLITLEVAECRPIFLGGGWPDELGSLVIRG